MKWLVCDLHDAKSFSTEEVRDGIRRGVIKKETRLKKMGSPIARKAFDILEFSLEWSVSYKSEENSFIENNHASEEKIFADDEYSFINKNNESSIIEEHFKEKEKEESWKITIQDNSSLNVFKSEKKEENKKEDDFSVKEDISFLRPTLRDDGFEITFLESSQKKQEENEPILIENKIARMTQSSTLSQRNDKMERNTHKKVQHTHKKVQHTHKKVQHTHKKAKISKGSQPLSVRKYGKTRFAYILENLMLVIIVILVISVGFLFYQKQNAKSVISPPYQRIDSIVPEAQLELPHASFMKELQKEMDSSKEMHSSSIAPLRESSSALVKEDETIFQTKSRASIYKGKPTPRPTKKPTPKITTLKTSLPMVRNGQDLHQNLQKNVQIPFVRYSSLKENCKPCHVPGRLLDGTSLVLVTFQYAPWKSFLASGNVQITGQVLRKQGNDYWIMVQALSKR